MAGSPYGFQDYGASPPGYVPINATFNDPNPHLNALQQNELLYNRMLDINPELIDFVACSHDIFGGLEPLNPDVPTILNELLSNGSSAASASIIDVQESAVCDVRPQMYERSQSLTFFVDPQPPPSKVVQLECLPPSPPADNTPNIPPHHRLSQFNAELHPPYLPPNTTFMFPPGIDDPSLGTFGTPLFKASVAPDRPLVSAMDIINNQDAHALHIADIHIPQLVTSPGNFMDQNHVQLLGAHSGSISCPASSPLSAPTYMPSMGYIRVASDSVAMEFSRGSAPTSDLLSYSNVHLAPISCLANNVPASPTYMHSNMTYIGAVSDSAAMDFSSTSAATFTSLSFQTSVQGASEGISLSAPVSPCTPSSVNMEAPHNQSFSYGVEDMESVHGANRTDFYKMHDKWRKHRSAQGGIKKKKQSRRASLSLQHSLAAPVGNNATHESTNHEESNPSYDNSRVVIRVKTHKLDLHDGYVWRKYGEKDIKEEDHPRSYLKCEESRRRGCRMLKRTQRCTHDEDYVDFMYLGRHNHHP